MGFRLGGCGGQPAAAASTIMAAIYDKRSTESRLAARSLPVNVRLVRQRSAGEPPAAAIKETGP